MTGKQLMDFADKIAIEQNMFYNTELDLQEEKTQILIKIERDPSNKKLVKQYNDVCEKQRLIGILKYQRLELMIEAKKI